MSGLGSPPSWRCGSAADLTAVLLCFFPAAYVLSMPYSEGLFLTAVALCIYFLGRRAWLLAGLTASIATLSRDPGIVLVGTCVVVGVVEIVSKRTWRPLAAILTAPIGFVLWTLFEWHGVGSPFAFVHAEAYWGQGLQWFGEPFRDLWSLITTPGAWAQANTALGGLSVLFVLITVGLMVWAEVRHHGLPLSWWLYTAGCIAFALATHWGGSEPRFVMVAFPLLAIAAVRLPRRFETVAVAGSAMLLAGLADGPVCSLTDPDGRRGLAATRATAPARRRTSRVPPGALPAGAPVTLRRELLRPSPKVVTEVGS